MWGKNWILPWSYECMNGFLWRSGSSWVAEWLTSLKHSSGVIYPVTGSVVWGVLWRENWYLYGIQGTVQVGLLFWALHSHAICKLECFLSLKCRVCFFYTSLSTHKCWNVKLLHATARDDFVISLLLLFASSPTCLWIFVVWQPNPWCIYQSWSYLRHYQFSNYCNTFPSIVLTEISIF